jgi:hypothetical protein
MIQRSAQPTANHPAFLPGLGLYQSLLKDKAVKSQQFERVHRSKGAT